MATTECTITFGTSTKPIMLHGWSMEPSPKFVNFTSDKTYWNAPVKTSSPEAIQALIDNVQDNMSGTIEVMCDFGQAFETLSKAMDIFKNLAGGVVPPHYDNLNPPKNPGERVLTQAYMAVDKIETLFTNKKNWTTGQLWSYNPNGSRSYCLLGALIDFVKDQEVYGYLDRFFQYMVGYIPAMNDGKNGYENVMAALALAKEYFMAHLVENEVYELMKKISKQNPPLTVKTPVSNTNKEETSSLIDSIEKYLANEALIT